jgi:hypothetical protein
LETRRFLLASAAGVVAAIGSGALLRLGRAAAAESGTGLPGSVGGVDLPDTVIAKSAAAMVRAASPEHLYNHCIRTYLFGALVAERDSTHYDREIIFTAAAMHDLGLIERYQTENQPFEMDSADAAMAFLVEHGVSPLRAELAWHAIALHTSPLSAHESAQLQLVGAGAGADVYGSGLNTLPADRVMAILKAYPRRGFRQGFPQLMQAYCERKPLATVGGWADAYCRAHVHGVAFPDIERGMDRFPYPDA